MKTLLITSLAVALTVTGCKKTGDGQYEVEKPVVGTVTDTIHTPTIDAHMDSTTVAVPKLQVKTDSATIKVPKVEIKKP